MFQFIDQISELTKFQNEFIVHSSALVDLVYETLTKTAFKKNSSNLLDVLVL